MLAQRCTLSVSSGSARANSQPCASSTREKTGRDQTCASAASLSCQSACISTRVSGTPLRLKSSKMVASTCAARGVVYWLGSQLYVQLTNRARGLSLVASRGPAFIMPASSGFAPLEAEPPSTPSSKLCSTAYANDERKKALGQDVGRTRRADGGATDPGVAFAGLGDPLLRWPDVAEITRRVREHHEVPISLYTSGLLPPDAPAAAEVASTLHAAMTCRRHSPAQLAAGVTRRRLP